jgi:hypothetical protein
MARSGHMIDPPTGTTIIVLSTKFSMYPGGLDIWQYPALVRYYSGGCCVFVSLLFTAHLINCAQLIN